jgi:16S rRNA processing protein RimM
MAEYVEVVVGVVGRAHGVQGEVVVDLRTDEPDRRFAAGRRLHAEDSDRVFTVTSTRAQADRLLVRFAELTDRTGAEAVRGLRLVADVPANERPAEAGEFYDRQLVGLRVRTIGGMDAGEVAAVVHLPQQDLLEVATPAGPRLVPFVAALVPEVDLSAGTLTVVDIDGLLADTDEPA